MLVRISPSIAGQKYGLGSLDIECLILATRLAGTTLYAISEWPCHVYVMRVVNQTVLKSFSFGKDDVELISWGTVHKTLDDAAGVALS